MPITLYRFQTQNLSFAECWYQTRSPAVLLAWIFKLLRVPLPNLPLIPRIDSIATCRIPDAAVREDLVRTLEKRLNALGDLGFRDLTWSRLVTPDERSEITVASCLDSTGFSAARVLHGENRVGPKLVAKTQFAFLSQLSDGTFLVSSGGKRQFRDIPGVRILRKPGAPVGQIWEMHQQALAEVATNNPPISMEGPGRVDAAADAYEDLVWTNRIGCGFYVPLTPEEQATESEREQAKLRLYEEVGPDYAPVLMELERAGQSKSSWKTTFWLLIGSLVLFIVARRSGSDSLYLVTIIPVLFIHEMGHWIAMRAFGYRNLKMLFIPFFGAAVTGKHYNVAGWKKAIVSLAGPAPGIVIAASFLLTAVTGVSLPEVWSKALLITLLVNAFNLLPILPLDGGWFLNAVLFCRHPLLETGFKIVAVLTLAGLAVFAHFQFLIYLGVITALSIPSTWRRGKIARDLRASGVITESQDGQTVPVPTAITIIDAIRRGDRIARTPANLAQETLSVFERLNAAPPNLLASLGLLATYAGIFIVIVLGFVGYGFVSHGGSALSYHPGEDAAWSRGPGRIPWTERYDVVGNFPDSAAAEEAFANLTNQPFSNVTLFGQSVFVTVPRKEAAGALKLAAKSVAQPLTGWAEIDGGNRMMQGFTISCTVPSPAIGTGIVEALDAYAEIKSQLPTDYVAAPPWAMPPGATPGQLRVDQRARHTWKLISELKGLTAKDPAIARLTKEYGEAMKANNSARAHELRQSMRTQRRDLTVRQLERYIAEGGDSVDLTLLNAELNRTRSNSRPEDSATRTNTSPVTSDPVSQLLTSRVLMLTGSEASVADSSIPSSFGNATAKGNKLKLTIRTLNAAACTPMVAHWLVAQGCTNLRYLITPVAVASEEESDDASQ